jgi:hypothetical protein
MDDLTSPRFLKLRQLEKELSESRLVKEETLGQEDSLTVREKDWLRENRSEEARYWNLLTMRTNKCICGETPNCCSGGICAMEKSHFRQRRLIKILPHIADHADDFSFPEIIDMLSNPCGL